MKRTNIYLDEEHLRALRAVAEQRDQPVAALIREAIDAWLQELGVRVIDEDEWRRRFSRLLQRRRREGAKFSQEEVDADVARAVREVRRARAARRR